MKTTIVADASFCPETKVAGYGFWIASNRGKKAGSGIVAVTVKNNIAAEMMALLNGLFIGRKNNLIMVGDKVLLQTDCQAAIDAFANRRRNISLQEIQLVVWFNEFRTTHKLAISMRHVKGHSRGKQKRFIANRICDRDAKVQMRKARHNFEILKLKEFINE